MLEPASLANTRVDDGSLPSASEIQELRAFLRVQDPATGRVHFQHPSNLQTAELLGEGGAKFKEITSNYSRLLLQRTADLV